MTAIPPVHQSKRRLQPEFGLLHQQGASALMHERSECVIALGVNLSPHIKLKPSLSEAQRA